MAHDHEIHNYNKAFALGITLNIAYVAVEVAVGLIIHSVALLADAGHNAGDVLSLLLAWGANYLGQRQPTSRHTYGLRRTSILASLANAILLLIAIGAIGWEAIRRIAQPHPIPGGTLMWVAGIGVVINALTALLFMKGRRHDLNIRSAFLHMTADAGVSAGVVIAGLMIQLTSMFWIDPVLSLAIVVVIAVGTWGLLRESISLALDAVPKGIDPAAVHEYLSGLPTVVEVHDLHIWGMSTTEVALTAHLIMRPARVDDALLARIRHDLHEKFHIEHATIQVESGNAAHPCSLASPETI